MASPDYLLVSQVFPPAIGGSGVLLDNVYSRIPDGRVVALVDEATCGRPRHDRITIEAGTISPAAWGLVDPRVWPHHWRLARAVRRISSNGKAIVHCGRAQPEGIAAFLASFAPGGMPYLFWAHGEDISAGLSSRQFSSTMSLVYGRASAAIANSRNTARLLEQTGWLKHPIDVVYPGVDSDRFTPTADDGSLRRSLSPGGELILMSVARLQRRKGHDLVLRALPELRRRHRITYVIVGDGPEMSSLRRMTEQLELQDSVRFVGTVSDDMLPAYFAAGDIFVLPTRVEEPDFEGFGIVFLEAAAAEKPTIGGRNGGVPEAVADGETGVLVDGDDLPMLTVALDRLCASEGLRLTMGRKGRLRTKSFSWIAAAEAVRGIHERVAAQRFTS
jgi:phosphatidylinositol alpha-1,6-mannosyltransferase